MVCLLTKINRFLHRCPRMVICVQGSYQTSYRSRRPEVFLVKGVPKICSEFTGEHGCFPVNLLHIFRTPFPKNTSGWLLLILTCLKDIDPCFLKKPAVSGVILDRSVIVNMLPPVNCSDIMHRKYSVFSSVVTWNRAMGLTLFGMFIKNTP